MSQTVLFSPAPEGGLVDPQNIGGFLERFGRRQDPPNMGFFERRKRYRVAQFWRGIVRRRDDCQIFEADEISPG